MLVRLLNILRPLNGHGGLLISNYSTMWPANFVEPIIHKSELGEAKQTGEYKKKTLVPIIAAPPDATCSVLLARDTIAFLNAMTIDGERQVAAMEMQEVFRIIKAVQLKKYYKAPHERRDLIITDPAELIRQAVENARPLLNLEKVTVGSIVYTVPTPITLKRSLFESRRWIMKAAQDRDKAASRFHQRLAEIIIETAHNSGRVIAVKTEHHKTCEQNRAYAHYRRSK
jgi:small subunit ribosomal protein S7